MVQQGQIDHLLQESGEIQPGAGLVRQAFLQDYQDAYRRSTEDAEAFWAEVAGEFSTLYPPVYFETLRQLGEHDASHVLPRLQAPLLVVTGSRDPLTPAFVSEQMARLAPVSEIMTVRGGTHYVPIEVPEYLALRVEKFLRVHDLLQPANKHKTNKVSKRAAI